MLQKTARNARGRNSPTTVPAARSARTHRDPRARALPAPTRLRVPRGPRTGRPLPTYMRALPRAVLGAQLLGPPPERAPRWGVRVPNTQPCTTERSARAADAADDAQTGPGIG